MFLTPHSQCVCDLDAGFSGADCSALISDVLPLGLCNLRHANSQKTALFSYWNRNTQSISIPVGPMNTFTSEPADRGQMTTFPSLGYGAEMFGVDFSDGDVLQYTLGERTVQMDASSPACAGAWPLGHCPPLGALTLLSIVPCPSNCNGNGFCDGGLVRSSL
jgi:hypothetical protein